MSILLVLTLLASAEPISIYRSGHAPLDRSDGPAANPHLAGEKKLNKGEAHADSIRAVNQYAELFGITKKLDGKSLQLRGEHSAKAGHTLRLVQRYDRVRVEAAEAVVNIDRKGRITSISASLMPTPTKFSVQPELAREEAVARAREELGDGEEITDIESEGLLIVRAGGKPVLVWRVYVQGPEGENPSEVQVIAKGKDKGEVLKTLSLGIPFAPVSIYDASAVPVVPNPIARGVKTIEDGKTTLSGKLLFGVDKKARAESEAADSSFSKTLRYYADTFDRIGYDGANARVRASVNSARVKILDFLGMGQNAAWMGPWKMFAFGAGGKQFAGFTQALDVVGHEFTHAVTEKEAGLEYHGQSGALNESYSDVLGAAVERWAGEAGDDEFELGERAVVDGGKALRHMLHPAKGLRPQPETMDEIPSELGPGCSPTRENDQCGVHILSGIPNRVFALVASKIGWEEATALWYRALTRRLRPDSDFADHRDQTLAECSATLADSACEAVATAFGTVGI